jgi:hypothetical protein
MLFKRRLLITAAGIMLLVRLGLLPPDYMSAYLLALVGVWAAVMLLALATTLPNRWSALMPGLTAGVIIASAWVNGIGLAAMFALFGGALLLMLLTLIVARLAHRQSDARWLVAPLALLALVSAPRALPPVLLCAEAELRTTPTSAVSADCMV